MRRVTKAMGGICTLAGFLLLLPTGARAGSMSPISLSKTVITPTGTCPGVDPLFIAAGTQVSYCYKVTNNGSITYTTHTLTDSILGSIGTGPCGNLAPGGMCTVSQTTTISVDTMNVATWVAMSGTTSATGTDKANVVIVTPPVITPPPPGSSTVTGTSDPACVGGQVLIFDCGFPPNCHQCTGLPCPDALIGMGSKDANGNFSFPLSVILAPGHRIYATDGCTDPGIAGPDVLIGIGQAPAPLLSGQALAMLAALLVLVGFVGLRRVRSNP